ncbi:hypothetical protein ACRS52_19900 [Bacillus cytotoxicus]|uniref:Uncharacterized protein n=1 Tax=Bacillus cytotoxicus TaxID=580165 RepID=A0AAX2CFG3_9BACI|nr:MULTISPECIES: hypothetical protein [Bacillus cereus group]MDH2880847.1 hypothetical protein [Bacillus cytotoxicus]QTR77619.1 hypothetical protein JC773_13710 [Bacillus cytotoxicus]QTR82560.1 hypothetical protein JC777_19030 [Bacillus cytotoxicus]QTR86298.1 hypothetical protein JC774_17535 [Bacillus cytotoxicus]SCL89655.1 Protein of unknown function [Bacillus cytotoxicus]
MSKEIKLLNRENVMIYRKKNITLLKTSYKTLKIELDDQEHKLLTKILTQTINGEWFSNIMLGNRKSCLKIVKLLINHGMLFSYYENDPIDRNKNQKWFPILSQYLPSQYNSQEAASKVEKSNIAIAETLVVKIPNIAQVFQSNNINVFIYKDKKEVKNNDFVITDKKEDILSGDQRYIFIQKFNTGICGTVVDYLDYELLDNEINTLVQNMGAFYIFIFTLKQIIGFGKDTFYINENGKFIENETKQGEIEVISTSQIPLIVSDIEPIDQIDNFEQYLLNNRIHLQISNHLTKLGELKQIGFSTYGMKDVIDNEEYSIAGLNFEKNSVETITFTLQSYLTKHTGNQWLVTTAKDYYYKKACLLLEHLEEPSSIFKMSSSQLRNIKVLSAYKYFLTDVNLYIERFEYSGAYKIYIGTEDQQLFGDNQKTIRLEEQIEKTVINYIFNKLNSEANVKTPYYFKEHKIKLTDLQEEFVPFHEDENHFIEKALRLFKENNIRYEEWAWTYEYELLKFGFAARRIDVGEYNE